MLKDVDIARMLSQLVQGAMTQLVIDGNDVLVRSFDNASKLALTTTVYSNGSYLPHKVRDSVATQSALADAPIRTFLSIDEANYRVLLHYVGRMQELQAGRFGSLLQEFIDTANRWRSLLEEQDRDDRIYVRKN